MMADLYVALGTAAPYYNLAFVVIAIVLFVKLFRTPQSASFMKPWYLIFGCIMLFVLEETLTILRAAGMFEFIPRLTNAFWELGIIILFIYAVLLQKQYVKEELALEV
jgi:hypothetical protein